MTTPAVADRAAKWTDVSGLAVAAHFGSPEREYEAARNRSALAPRPWRSIVRVTGDDRGSFLQGLLTNDIEGLEPGVGCRALFLDVKGHVRADLDVWAEEDALVIGCDVSTIETAIADLRKYVLGASVAFENRQDLDAVFGLVGPDADAWLKSAGVDLPAASERAHVTVRVLDTSVRLARTPSLGGPGLEVHVPSDAAAGVLRTLEEASEAAPPELMGWEAAEMIRVEAGWPAAEREITASEFPQEAGMDEAVDYEKGCYLGQETVARIHYRGRVNRRLSGLRFEAVAAAGAELVVTGQKVGLVTSAVVSPRFGPIGLGYVRRQGEDESEFPAEVHVDGQAIGGATVTTLPFSA